MLVEADHVSCRIAESRSDLGRVRADRLHDLAPMGYNRDTTRVRSNRRSAVPVLWGLSEGAVERARAVAGGDAILEEAPSAE